MRLKKKKVELADGERLDDLVIRGMKIFQHEAQFSFSVDAILLAHFAFLKKNARCVDLGTGTGVIALLLAARGAAHIDAVELNPVMAQLAARSVQLNALNDVICIHAADFREIRQIFPPGAMDLVVSNPPYCPMKKGALNQFDAVASARHEVTGTLHDVVQAAKHLVKYRGRFAMVHLPERLSEIVVEMHAAGIEPKRLQMVQPMKGKRPTMVLVEGVLGAKPGLVIEAPFIVHASDGSYTDEMMAYYRGDGI